MQGNTRSMPKPRPRETRRANRRSNAIFLKIAGGPLRAYSMLKHVARSSGREYVTPLSPYPLGDGFVMAVIHGEATKFHWLRNAMAAGKCIIHTRRQEDHFEKT